MDHAPFGTLRDMVTGDPIRPGVGKLHWKLARHIAGQIVAFLAEAHSVQGVAHQRLNPSNCFFDSRRRLKIADFRHA